MTYASHTFNDALPSMFNSDPPAVPALETLPLLRPDHPVDGTLFDWAVESLELAGRLRDECEALHAINRDLRERLAASDAFWRARRKSLLRESMLTAGALGMVALVVLLVAWSTP